MRSNPAPRLGATSNPQTVPPGDTILKAVEEFPRWWFTDGFLRACSRVLALPWASPATFARKAWTYAAWRASPRVSIELQVIREDFCGACEYNQQRNGKSYCASCGCGVPRVGATKWETVPVLQALRAIKRHWWKPLAWSAKVAWTFVVLVFVVPFIPRDPSLANKNSREAHNCPLGRQPGSRRTVMEATAQEREGKPGLPAQNGGTVRHGLDHAEWPQSGHVVRSQRERAEESI